MRWLYLDCLPGVQTLAPKQKLAPLSVPDGGLTAPGKTGRTASGGAPRPPPTKVSPTSSGGDLRPPTETLLMDTDKTWIAPVLFMVTRCDAHGNPLHQWLRDKLATFGADNSHATIVNA